MENKKCLRNDYLNGDMYVSDRARMVKYLFTKRINRIIKFMQLSLKRY